jgi:hypothetical protein
VPRGEDDLALGVLTVVRGARVPADTTLVGGAVATPAAQTDSDGDGLTNDRDDDDDGDDIADGADDDVAGDGVADADDLCPDGYDPYQWDSDADGIGDSCDHARTLARSRG